MKTIDIKISMSLIDLQSEISFIWKTFYKSGENYIQFVNFQKPPPQCNFLFQMSSIFHQKTFLT